MSDRIQCQPAVNSDTASNFAVFKESLYLCIIYHEDLRVWQHYLPGTRACRTNLKKVKCFNSKPNMNKPDARRARPTTLPNTSSRLKVLFTDSLQERPLQKCWMLVWEKSAFYRGLWTHNSPEVMWAGMKTLFMRPCQFDGLVNVTSYAELWCNGVEHMRNSRAHICCACPMMMPQVTSGVIRSRRCFHIPLWNFTLYWRHTACTYEPAW